MNMVAYTILAAMCQSVPASAQQTSTACVTRSECEGRIDRADQQARNAQWNQTVRANDDLDANIAAAHAQARQQLDSERGSRLDEVMRRRRAAALASAKP